MKTEEEVLRKIAEYKTQGIPMSDAVWNTAKECVGWPYVFGAWGQECTPNNRRKQTKADNGKCQVIAGTSSGCGGCKWFPGEERVLMFDCRGFTGWVLEQFGIKISRTGATSQWKGDYWEAKGTIDTIPDDVLCCLFCQDKKEPAKMSHTGFGYRGATCECSVGVQYFEKRKAKWTHWAIPRGIGGGEIRPILKKGDRGTYVQKAQALLIKKGYDLGKWGADGVFGAATEQAVREFQWTNGLEVDGIIGPDTWDKLLEEGEQKLYTVHIPHLTTYKAEGIMNQYAGSWKTEEGE